VRTRVAEGYQLRIAVVQHRIRTHERIDLAALLSLSERAAEEHADVIVYPYIPGLCAGVGLVEAFAQNVTERAPQVSMVAPCAVSRRPGPLEPFPTRLGTTLVLSGDDCIDPAHYPAIERMGLEALVWQTDTETSQQAEALLELGLDASLSLSGLVLIAGVTGHARGVTSFGGSAIVHLGEIVAEAGDGDDLLVADVATPATLPVRRGPRCVPAPVLAQRLAEHRS
jgi:predicted amidohydrolase